MVTIQYHKVNLRVLFLIPLHTLSNKYYHQITIQLYYHRELYSCAQTYGYLTPQ